MDARKRGGLNGGQAVTRGRLLAITLWLATSAGAELVPGGGNTKNDCLVELDVRSGTPVPSATKGNPTVVCTDCDPRCDTGALRDGICRFQVALCVNQGNVAGCTATALGHAVAKVAGTRLAAPALDGSPACGAVTEVAVKSKRARPGKAVVSLRASSKGKPRRLDKERVVLQCKPAAPCSCAGGAPTKLSFTTDVGSGQCGHLDADGSPGFFPLACGGLYFGGGGVIQPLPAVVPDMGQEMFNTCCSGTSLFLGPTTEAATGSKRTCSSAGCLFGPPLPLPNPAAPPISTCLVNVVAKDASGSADCSTGVTDLIDLPLDSEVFLDGDLLPTRCVGGSTPGAPCGGCASPTACPGGGTCTNDTGRCSGGATPGAPCCSGSDCGAGTCKPGHCLAGTSAGVGCVSDTECPGSRCDTFIQACPVCDAGSRKCNGGPNNGLDCTPGDSLINGGYPTSHDCPPPGTKIASLPIAFALTSGTTTRSSTDKAKQSHVFCGQCRDPLQTFFKSPPCNGSNPDCACTSDDDCADEGSFSSCQQRSAGAFTQIMMARTITETGTPAGAVTTGGAPKASTLVSVFCVPPSSVGSVDALSSLPGPGAVALQGKLATLP